MKYLENLKLEQITNQITNLSVSGGRKLNGRIELYATKRAGNDKRTSKLLQQRLGTEMIIATTSSTETTSVYDKSLLKLHIDLIQTLNASLIDYDFSELTAKSFVNIKVNEIVSSVNSILTDLTTIENPTFLTNLWNEIDEGITLSGCEGILLKDDPFLTESNIMSSNIYFLFNSLLKRVCLLTINISSPSLHNEMYDNDAMEDEMDDMDKLIDSDDEDMDNSSQE